MKGLRDLRDLLVQLAEAPPMWLAFATVFSLILPIIFLAGGYYLVTMRGTLFDLVIGVPSAFVGLLLLFIFALSNLSLFVSGLLFRKDDMPRAYRPDAVERWSAPPVEIDSQERADPPLKLYWRGRLVSTKTTQSG